MTRFYKLWLSLLMLVSSLDAAAQIVFSGSGGGRLPVLMAQSGYGQDIQNDGATTSPAYKIRAWASTDRAFQDNEVISDIDYPGLGPGEMVRRSYTHPTPLVTDSRLLKDIIGEPYFFQMCIEIVGSAPTCRIDSRAVNTPDPGVTAASSGTTNNGVEIEYTVVTRNGETPFDFLRIGWRDRALDGGPAQAETVIDVPAAALTIVEDGQTRKRYRFVYESTPGVPGNFRVRHCYSLPVGPTCLLTPRSSTELGYRTANASATQGSFNDQVQVEWPRFAFAEGFDAYQITRCREGAPQDCVLSRVASIGPLERFVDTAPVRGERYIYTIDACIGTSLNSCDPEIYMNIAVSQIGFVGLVDEFEEDDTAAQATFVDKDVSQVHSFDTPIDDDWLRISLDRPGRIAIETAAFNAESVDTILTLFDAQQVALDENDDKDPANAPGSFSRIETERLDAGEYFIKATHYKLPGGEFPAPTANNYVLSVAFLDAKADLSPIIQLLLLDDE